MVMCLLKVKGSYNCYWQLDASQTYKSVRGRANMEQLQETLVLFSGTYCRVIIFLVVKYSKFIINVHKIVIYIK